MTNNLLLELFCGTGSISEAFQELGWQTVGVDITDHGYKAGPLLVMDMQDFVTKDFIAKYGRPKAIWASPPCTEFSTAKYYAYGTSIEYQGLDLVWQAFRIIDEAKPDFFIVENVKGLARFIDKPTHIIQYGPSSNYKSAYLWGNFPIPGMFESEVKNHHDKYGNSDIRRARIPEPMARAVAKAIHSQI